MGFSSWVRSFVLIGALGTAAVTATLYSFNHFDSVEPVQLGRCNPVSGIVGAEDIMVDQARGLAFISSLDRRKVGPKRGAIHAVPIADPLDAASWRDRTRGAPQAFEPLGLSYYDDGEFQRLFVVNSAANAVELFDVRPNGDLVHLDSFTDTRLTSPNSVVATSARGFYVSNDLHAGRNSILGKLQFLTRVGGGSILYFNGVSWREAASGLRFANGLALSPDGRQLYVAETSGMAVKTFARDLQTGFLTLDAVTPVPGAADNLRVDASGAVLVAANPKPLSLPRHLRDAGNRSPSAVYRIDRPAGPNADPEALYVSNGGELSAATVADIYGGKLIIGALAEDRFLICNL